MTTKKFSLNNFIKLLKNMVSKKTNPKDLSNHKIDVRNYKKPYQWPEKNIHPLQKSQTRLNQHAWTEE